MTLRYITKLYIMVKKGFVLPHIDMKNLLYNSIYRDETIIKNYGDKRTDSYNQGNSIQRDYISRIKRSR